MKFGIDASQYNHPQPTGAEWYSHFLLDHLIPLLGRDHHHEMRLYTVNGSTIEGEFPFNVEKKTLRLRQFSMRKRISLELFFHPVDVYFSPSGSLPFFTPKKTIISIQDLAFEHIQHSQRRRKLGFVSQWLKKKRIQRIVRKSSKILVPSESVKKDLMGFYRCSEEKIIVIPLGAPQISPLSHWTDEEIQEKRRQFFLNERDLFIFFVGTLESKKNLVRLVEAFKRFLVEFPDWKIILAGKRGDGFEEIWKKVIELQLEKNVIAPGYITEKEKNFLYAHCRFVAFPSLYQGFGMPVLEAFAFRRPILTSKVFGPREVADQAAFLVNPEKVEEISIGLKRLAGDGVLVSRLIQKGSQQIEKFSWEKCALQTYDAIIE